MGRRVHATLEQVIGDSGEWLERGGGADWNTGQESPVHPQVGKPAPHRRPFVAVELVEWRLGMESYFLLFTFRWVDAAMLREEKH